MTTRGATADTTRLAPEAFAERAHTIEAEVGRVTVGQREVARPGYTLEQQFVVLATQNLLEMEGTYPLPEAQLDRFIFKVMVPFPSEEDLVSIVDRTTGTDAPVAGRVTTAAEIIEMQRLAR